MNKLLFCLMTIFCIFAVIAAWKRRSSNSGDTIFSEQSGFLSFLEKHENQIAVFLLLGGIFIRVFYFWEFPRGLNQDEASIGYDAWADLTYGMDRNGDHNPVYSVAWGSGQFALYKLFSCPWIALFGLNTFSVRIVNVLFGCIALFSFWRIAQLFFKSKSTIALFFFVINPWHIMMCRWGLESNLLPNLFLIALHLLLYAPTRRTLYPISLFLFGLTLYAYGTAWIVVPFFLVLSAAYLLYHKKISLPMVFLSGLVFIVTVFPLGVFLLVEMLDLEPIRLGFMTIPNFSVSRYESTVTILSNGFLKTIFVNLESFFSLLWTQDDGLIWNSIPAFGTIYLFSTPFVLLGLADMVRKGFRREYRPEVLLLFMLFAVFLLGATSVLNINRANLIFIPLIFLMADGVLFVLHAINHFLYPLFIVYFCAFLLFLGTYFIRYPFQIGPAFFDGLGDAISYAADETEGTIYLSDSINAPYIHVLFFEQIEPNVFLDSVEYADLDVEFRQVLAFDRYVTGIPSEKQIQNTAYILHANEIDQFDHDLFQIVPFVNYYVAIGNE